MAAGEALSARLVSGPGWQKQDPEANCQLVLRPEMLAVKGENGTADTSVAVWVGLSVCSCPREP